jgi:hypothetical protein
MEQLGTHLSFCALKHFLVESDCIKVFQLFEAMNEIREYHRSNWCHHIMIMECSIYATPFQVQRYGRGSVGNDTTSAMASDLKWSRLLLTRLCEFSCLCSWNLRVSKYSSNPVRYRRFLRIIIHFESLHADNGMTILSCSISSLGEWLW